MHHNYARSILHQPPLHNGTSTPPKPIRRRPHTASALPSPTRPAIKHMDDPYPNPLQQTSPMAPIPPMSARGSRPSTARAPKPSTLSILRNAAHVNLRNEDVPVVELQAAFENAFQRTLQTPPPSVVETVLSSQWKPKRAGQMREQNTPFAEREKGWNSRNPADTRGIQPYDAVLDFHCRRVVENPTFSRQIRQTRPSSAYLLHRRVIAEEKRVQTAQSKLRCHDRSSAPSWLALVTTPAPTPLPGEEEDDSDSDFNRGGGGGPSPSRRGGATRSAGGGGGIVRGGLPVRRGGGPKGGEGLDGSPRPSTAPAASQSPKSHHGGNGLRGMDLSGRGGMRNHMAAEAQNGEAGAGAGAGAGGFSSLHEVLSDGPHLPTVFAHLSARLEKLWKHLHVPESERKRTRKIYFSAVTTTNLSHLFYQVSRWMQYQTQLSSSLALILEREQLLKDVHDHLSLAGGVMDEALKRKLSAFYALSLRTLNGITTLKTLYAGTDPSDALLQDYIAKIKMDTAHLRSRHSDLPPPSADGESEGGHTDRPRDLSSTGVYSGVDGTGVSAMGQNGGGGGNDSALQQSKVQLAAELILDQVSREAQMIEGATTTRFLTRNPVELAAPSSARAFWDPSPRRPQSRR